MPWYDWRRRAVFKVKLLFFKPRRIFNMSRNPLVVRNAVFAPFPVNTAFVVMVVPWTMDSISDRNVPRFLSRSSAAFCSPLNTPCSGLEGVVGVLYTRATPSLPVTRKSVNVPPTSMPILYFKMYLNHYLKSC